jgi:ABC-2 type transport system permease protein
MLRYVIQMEFRTLRHDRWAIGLLVLLGALVAIAVVQGARWQREQQQKLLAVQTSDESRFDTFLTQHARLFQGSQPSPMRNDPRITMELAQQGRIMTLPLLDTSVLGIGHADLLPQQVHVSAIGNESSLWNRLEIENPMNARSGRFDLAFVVVFLLPLFLLALTFHLLPGDREQGILALSLAQSASLTPVLITRLAVRGLLVWSVVTVVALITMSFMNVPWLREQNLWRIGMWLALVMGYTVFWLAISFLANAYASNAASSALMLATAWLALVVLLPALFNAVLVRVCAPPSRVQLVSAMRTATREATMEASKTLAEYYQDHPELRPPGKPNDEAQFIASYFATRERSEKDVAPVLKAFVEQVERQQELVAKWQYLLPPVLLDEAFGSLAGTGSIRHAHFRGQVRQSLAAWQDWFVPRLVKGVGLNVTDHDAIPRPAYVDESKGTLLQRLNSAVLLLAAMTILFGVWATARMRRYSITA